MEFSSKYLWLLYFYGFIQQQLQKVFHFIGKTTPYTFTFQSINITGLLIPLNLAEQVITTTFNVI